MGWSLANFADPVGMATLGFTNSKELTESSFGDFIPGIGDAKAQDKANKLNIQLQKENRDWMERMSNTAYQRAMEDMRSAGLNPIIAYQQGGASVPTSTAATVDPASKTKLVDTALGAFTGISAAQTARQQANTAQAQAESTIGLQAAQAGQTIANTAKTEAETQRVKEQIKSEQVRRKLDEAQVPLAKTKQTAAELAQRGSERVIKAVDSISKNAAKPKMNPKTLQYEKPWYDAPLEFVFGNKKN